MRDDDRTTRDRTDPQSDPSNQRDRKGVDEVPNPPRTTTNGITAPKFGSAGSGGAELEPGPERD
jgi:hypothetical protein